MKNKTCLIAGMALLLGLIFGLEGVAQDQIFERPLARVSNEYVPNEIIVKFKPRIKEDVIANLNSRHGTSVLYTSPFAGFKRLTIPKGKRVSEMVAIYKKDPNIEYAELNYIRHALWVPNDPYYSYQWHMDNAGFGGINMEDAWDISTGAGVVVAVIDSGVAYENYTEGRGWWRKKYYLAPDLAQTQFVSGYDFVNNDDHPGDDNAHGTHVTGTIAQSTNNNKGTAGVAFDCSIMPVKVLDKYGTGYDTDIAEGIMFAADNGAAVINLSLGGPSPSTTLENACAYAYNKGVIIICSSGNDGAGTVNYPAGYDAYVIAVGATRYDETLANYSNYGPSLDIVAPGGDLDVDQNGDGYGDGVLQNTFNPNTRNTSDFGYWFFEGTSQAAPHVSGVAALLIAYGNAVTPDEVRAALQETAEDLGAPGPDDTYGYGLVDAFAALQWSAGPVDNPPVISITTPTDGAIISGTATITADATDDVGVNKVEFYYDSTLIGTDFTSPYSVGWDTTAAADSTYTITATATDSASQSASDSISVTVDNINDPPVANAGPDQTFSDADGTGAETVTLDGSASYDSDGTVSSYEWAEGPTLLGTGKIISYNFAVGAHTVTLTVTDNKGATGSNTIIVTVNPNQAPTANAGPDKAASVGQTVSFNGSGSSDPDGSIVSYSWDFDAGDGIQENASGVTTSHAYSAAGIYTVTLTVKDNGNLTDTHTATVTVTDAPTNTMHVESIDMKVVRGFWIYRQVRATILITDSTGNPVSGAKVTGNWSGAYNKTGVSATTGIDGKASFKSKWRSGTFTFTVTDVSKSGWIYDSSQNKETSDSI